jgi:hypothetical protein
MVSSFLSAIGVMTVQNCYKVNDPNGYNAEIYVINTAGTVQNQVVSGINGDRRA